METRPIPDRDGIAEDRVSRALLLVAPVAAIVLIALVDQATSAVVSFAAGYVIPVAVLAWYFGRTGGYAASVVAAAAELVSDIAARDPGSSAPTMAWNAVSLLLISAIVAEVTARLHRALASERGLARTDPLTGVANWRRFRETAERELERMVRYGGVFTVAFLDMDHFKLVNDTLGHHAGDQLLVEIADALSARLRRVDLVARFGGDEFIVLMPETDRDAACVVLEHVRDALADLTSAYGPGVRASIGSVTFREAPVSVDEMISRADAAMYSAKYGGRDRVVALTVPPGPAAVDGPTTG